MLPLKNNIFTIMRNDIKIVPFSDWHIGTHNCNMRLIKKLIEYVRVTKNCYAIGLGDLIDMITYQSKGLIHTQKLMATEQIKTIIALLKPIRHKILFMLTGNHEDRTVKNSALDVMELISNSLEIPYKGYECHFGLRFQRNNKSDIFCCYAHHNSGGGGGVTKGGKHNKLINLHWSAPISDLIIGGHTHGHSTDFLPIIYMDRNGNVVKKIQHFVAAGNTLDGRGDYAAQSAMPPNCSASKLITISVARTAPRFRVKFEDIN